MRARTLILLFVALILAGGTTMMARVWLASQKQNVTEATPLALQTPAKTVLVVHTAIQRGQLLKAGDLAWEPWPQGDVNKAYIVIGGKQTPETFVGWVARQPISAGEPLSEDKIVAPGAHGFLAAVLRPGMRAVSIPINAATGVDGLIFPGDQVDIMVAHTVQNPSVDGGPSLPHPAVETVLTNVRVIAIDQKLDATQAIANAKTATLEVTPREGEAIALASELGKLSLSLRSLVPDPARKDNDQPLADRKEQTSGVITILHGNVKQESVSWARTPVTK
jgi:pilus assembly protein CpaB